MAKVKPSSGETTRNIRPALNPESREKQMIALAVDLAEKQLLDGTASSQVITHYLKLGTMKEQLEIKKIEQEIELNKAKTKALADAEEIKALYSEALIAMRKYNGQGQNEEDNDEDDEYDD